MKTTLTLLFALFGVALFAGCSTAPKTENARANLDDETQVTLKRFEREDPSLEDFLSKAAGYAMFPNVGKGGVGVGGAYGHGRVYEGGTATGWANLSQASIGLQLGGQEYSELVVFGTADALNRFKMGKLEFGANASAVALKAGASSAARFNEGVAVFTAAKGGLMFEATLAGQKLNFEQSAPPAEPE